jgi:hypothetical protein
MVTTKRVLLGLLVLGVVGMHALVTTGGAGAGHHVAATAPVVSSMHVTSSVPLDVEADRDQHGSGPLMICVALLIGLVVTSFRGRRATWVALLDRPARSVMLPLPPALLDRTSVPRFTVMRC